MQSPPGKGMAIASLVMGILSLIFCWLVFIGLPCAIVGIVLGILGKRKLDTVNAPSGTAIAGLVMSIIGLVLLIIIYAIVFFIIDQATRYYSYGFWDWW